MLVSQQIIDPFHLQLHRALVEEIDTRGKSLIAGAATSFDDYRFRCGYIEALVSVLARCEEMERERYGARPGSGDSE